MLIQQTDEAEIAINNGEIEKIRNSLDLRILASIIESNRFDLIEIIYHYFQDTEPMEQNIFDAVIESAGVDVTPASIQCLNLLLSIDKGISYTFDDDDALYYMCQIPGSVELFKLILELKTEIPWDYILQVSCSFIRRDTIEFVIENIQLSTEDIELAFSDLIHSPVTLSRSHHSGQNEMVSWFINKLNVDVNLKTDSDWKWAYLDCFLNVPNAAKQFYTKDFDPSIINSEKFWAEFLESILEDEAFKQVFHVAFEDLRNSGLDLTELRNIFDRLGHQELAKELLNE
ncbi:hypothetical protein KCN56_01710 [Photobacterium galatheae]|uniref:hypothetical protein n=1 Tax=Photobacterium galatheae TaxID=1654360 RepID=UPI00202CBF50|nr:hypothetical protein [Photobacterium galatheae]MCM0147286.1 hypothetical protein [Photobacterium galatheae]